MVRKLPIPGLSRINELFGKKILMKKSILILLTLTGVFNLRAQNINPETDQLPSYSAPKMVKKILPDSLLPAWVLDINADGGMLFQNFTNSINPANYSSPLNANIGSLKFDKGYSYGFDAQLGYFFGKKRNFGIGAGVLYMRQQGDITLGNYNIEYKSVDKFGDVFRQKISGNGVKEKMVVDNVNIPIVLKYKNKINNRWGFTADAGLLVNIKDVNKYTGNGTFDYEAIYKYTGTEGNLVAVYDNSQTPSSGDLLITKQQYLVTHSPSGINNYFNTLRSEGYNVGLNVSTGNQSGSTSYKTMSLGFIARPAISYYFSNKAALDFGLLYIYQGFSNDVDKGYMITNKVGDYSSVTKSISKAVNHNIGVSLGLRFYLGKAKTPAVVQVIDTLPMEPEPVAEPVSKPTPAPVVKEEPEEEEEIAPVLFDVDKATIKKSEVPILKETIDVAKKNENAVIEVHGYTDNTGTKAHNKVLSKKRAVAVKKYLVNKGVNPKAIIAEGHGVKAPIATNKTREGRAKNRRVIIKVNPKK